MCYHNYSQHNGCGHIGESHNHPWTLCDAAVQRLNDLRGPGSPPVSPPATNFHAPPKRTSSTRRFFSLSGQLSRSSTSASLSSSRRGTSGPSALDYSTLPDHQLVAVKCDAPVKRTHVSRDMAVCKDCARWITQMRHMIQRYDKTGSIRGTSAFEKFLKWEGEGGGEREGDLTIPLDDGDQGGPFGARQAIILGHPESAMNAEGPRGLGTLERGLDDHYRY
ncbi:heme binding [Pyrenophora seminiperda CCB06]|uniref:Heme binding n=1 Tax=Pyrenophora seminiperda CCB06 TaxID=1302712 RepID=A0A3M7MDY7_9PLEO|nr:heme binding [Pyrenophora seminiperda CCB06]